MERLRIEHNLNMSIKKHMLKMTNKNARPMHLEWPMFKWVQIFIKLGAAFAIYVIYSRVVIEQEFETFIKAAAPILAIYVSTAALFYNRGRGLPKGVSKIRSLYAAERATQALLFSLVGVISGFVIFTVANFFKIQPPSGVKLSEIWLIIYAIPLIFLEFGYASYLLCLRSISKDLLRPVSAREISRRLKNAP